MMNLDTRGFADGFLNGFKTMADYQSQQKADKRADESLQMQKDENANAEKWRKTDYDHTLNREKISDDSRNTGSFLQNLRESKTSDVSVRKSLKYFTLDKFLMLQKLQYPQLS